MLGALVNASVLSRILKGKRGGKRGKIKGKLRLGFGQTEDNAVEETKAKDADVPKEIKAKETKAKKTKAKETKAKDAKVKERSKKALKKKPMTKREMAKKLKRNKKRTLTKKADIMELLEDNPELLKKYLAEKKSGKLTKKQQDEMKKALNKSNLKKLTKGAFRMGV